MPFRYGHGQEGPRHARWLTLADDSLRHVALFYRDQAECRARILGFVRAGLARGEPTFVALPGDEARLLGGQLGEEPGELLCADIGDVGRNPARLIPEVQAFIDKHAGQRVLIVGRGVWPGRSAAEICESHPARGARSTWPSPGSAATIMCAYDATRLPPAVITDARCTHPEYLGERPAGAAPSHRPPWRVPSECDRPLPPPPAGAESLAYDTDLAPVRRLVERHARGATLGAERVADLVLAASEVAANTLDHTRSGGTFQVWHDEDEIICQAHDQGWITDPLAGRVRRGPDGRGHGLSWSTTCATWSRSGPARPGPRSGCTCACRPSLPNGRPLFKPRQAGSRRLRNVKDIPGA